MSRGSMSKAETSLPVYTAIGVMDEAGASGLAMYILAEL